MTTTSIDVITRRWLIEHGYPIHYYIEGVFHSATCLRELNFDVLKIINVANLSVDAEGNISIPNDFVDDIAVTIPVGGSLKNLPKQDWITPIRIHDAASGQFTTYTDTTNAPQTFCGFPFNAGWGWFWNVNSFGEPTGQYYGARGGTSSGYAVFKQQRRIQLSENFAGTNVVLLYIGDGSSIDNATQIDPQAFATIDAFISWKRSPNRDNENSPEGRTFYNQRRRLVARLDDLTVADIRNIVHQNYTASIKN